MDDALLDLVLQRLGTDPLPEPSTDLLLAAMGGDQALAGILGGETAPHPSRGPDRTAPPRPPGAYLTSLTVTGFRGIGPPATLHLSPGPGLTLVLGRNGSGKSTFAEGLEALLTGNLSRWSGAPKGTQREGWRSIHQTGAAEIAAGLLIEGTGAATVRRSWPAGAEFAGSADSVEVPGEKTAGLTRLGWSAALQAYRPFLSHAELAAFSGRPSELHDVIFSVLGLEDLTATVARLTDARKQQESALGRVKGQLPSLLDRAAATGDERAGTCHRALRGRNWDLAAVQSAAASSTATDTGELARLHQLAQLTAPDAAEVQSVAADLRTAAAALESVEGSATGQAHALAGLLEDALRLHAEHGDGDCPVCRRPGALTASWRQETTAHLTRLREEAQQARAAHESAARITQRAAALRQRPPVILPDPPPAGLSADAARNAWVSWVTPPDAATPLTPTGLRALAAHLDKALPQLADELAALTAQAKAQIFEREDRWAPVAQELRSWCTEAAAALKAAGPAADLKAAETWLKAAASDIRNARLAPLADQARQIWQRLRQESNVDLGEIRLSGTATQRRLELNVSVDGTPGTALSVMSQGEINALALSIFVPRATMAESPFSFLVIDDPVQAMDPAKVDGLARVLEQAAAGRQVIVFTHDNRLADAVRHLRIPATVLEVTRRPKSVVEVRECRDPVGQAFADAFALCEDDQVPSGVARRVVPGLCRTAVEAAFTDAVWRRQAREGLRHEDTEAALLKARRRLTTLAALAIFGSEYQSGEVHSTMGRWGQRFVDTYQALNKGAHGAYGGDLARLTRDAKALTTKISSLP